MRTKQQVKEIIEALEKEYPDAICSLPYPKDYELLFAVRLSAQCTDERVNKVTPELFARFPTLQSFAEAEPEEVEPYIHPADFITRRQRISWTAPGSLQPNTGVRSRTIWRNC